MDDLELRKALSCLYPNCRCGIAQLSASAKGNKLVLKGACTAGHENEFVFDLVEKRSLTPITSGAVGDENGKADRIPDILVRGVHQYNGKTNRQSLLAYVNAGDLLEVEKGSFAKGTRQLTCYYLRHALGVIGTVQNKDAERLDLRDGTRCAAARVTKVLTSDKDGEKSYGCVVELYTKPSDKLVVYLVPDGCKIYHTNPNCSGLQGAQPMALSIAEKQGYRPCKRCVNVGGKQIAR